MQKLDIYKHDDLYKNWKEDALNCGIDNLTKENSDILIKFIFDLEAGVNVNGSKKGGRSTARLNNVRQRMSQMFRMMQARGIKNFSVTSRKDLLQLEIDVAEFFKEMRNGEIKTDKGNIYKSVDTYVSIFKSFWHWYQKVNRKKGKVIFDITLDLDATPNDPKFVYITHKDFKEKYLPHFDEDEQTFLLFVFDSLIRWPTEALSLTVNNTYNENGDVWVHIPKEIAKTKRDRDFNLLMCGDEILDYIKRKKLEPADYLFNLSPPGFIDKMQKVAKQIWGDSISHPKAGELYKNITPYDLRHSGAIYYRIMAKKNPGEISLDAVRERGGWSNFKMLDYYTKFIGIDGKIEKRGLLTKKEMTDMEKEIDRLKNNDEANHRTFVKMQRRLSNNEAMMKLITDLVPNVPLEELEKFGMKFNKK